MAWFKTLAGLGVFVFGAIGLYYQFGLHRWPPGWMMITFGICLLIDLIFVTKEKKLF